MHLYINKKEKIMFKLNMQKKDHRFFCGNKYEKYSIKKLKVGAASVLVGTGFLFGYNVDKVSANEQNAETTAMVTSKDGSELPSADKSKGTAESKQENTQEVVTETLKPETKDEAVLATSPQVAETKETPETKEVSENKVNSADKETVNSSTLRANLADLEAQIERIRGNKKQASQIQNAEKLVADARQYLEALNTTQKEVDAKAKEISSLTSILKSIKAEETVKENKNQDSRNGKKMEEGVGFRADTATGTGISADVKDATSTPAATRDGYTDRAAAESLTKQITWLDFGDVANWQNVDNEGGRIYLKEGSVYRKEVIPNYFINIRVKSLKPFQATEIYRKRMEAANASEEEKATFNPNATNQHFGGGNGPSRVTADQQDGTWSEVRNNGINTGNKKTAIGAGSWSNIGVQFEISASYKGKNVRPAVIMNDSESANHGENIILTTNGSPWERVLELKKERFVGGTFTPTPYKPINNYNLRHEDYPQSGGRNNASQLLDSMRGNLLTLADGTKFAPKYMTNPDQEMGGIGTGVFGPVTSSGGYSLPILMTKDATEVGLYILSSGIQTAMMGVIPIDEGDAPESYGKASHTINTVNGVTGGEVKQPYLGSTRPDMDTGTTKDWYGDDNDSDADESVNQLLPENLKESEGNIIKANISKSGNYTLNVQAHTGGAEKAYIRSWIDFNKNGQFDADEASEIATITTDGTVKLNFKNKRSADVETLLEAGARVRIATAESEIENPTGTAFSGEVEDFVAKITHPPKGEKKTTVGNIKETQREEIHFTAQGKNVYLEDHPNAEIDTTVQPTYIDNKTGQEVTLSSDGTYTVEGEGTYKFAISDNGKDVKVEFTPADGFVGKANGITIRRQDTNKTTTDWGTPDATTLPNVNDSLNTMDGLYIPEVTVPTSVNATPVNADSQNLQGLPQKGKPTFTVETSPTPVTASAKYPAKLVDPRTNTVTELTTVDAFEQGTTNKIGTYTIVPETGEVTFTPNKDFKGIPAPATISADVELTHDKDGNVTTKTLQATYSPTIIPVTPTAEASTTSDVQGKVQTSPIKLDTEETGDDKGKTVNFDKGTQTGPKGERVELNPETLTLLNEAGAEVDSVTTPQGTYALDKANKTISFTPNKDFVGTATPVKVQIKDMNGTKVETTYTPTVTDVTMESVDKTSEAPQGQTQTGKPEFKISSPDVQITGYKLVDPVSKKPVDGTEIEVPEQGTYKIDKTTGQVTFIPKAGFTGPATGITVQATDENGETKDAKYTPTVTPLTVTPENKTSKNIQGVPQEGTPTFTIPEGVTNASITSRKLVDPTDNTPKDSVTVEGKGTFVIDETGKVTFTPVPSYTGEVPAIEVQATVTVTNEKNEPATITSKATYKPEIVPVKPTAEASTTSDVQGKVQTSSIVLDTEETGDDKGKTVNFNKGIEQGPKGERTELNPDTLTLLNEAGEEVTSVTTPQGKYELDKANKTIIFTPNKDFAGEATPVKVQIKDVNGTKVETTYTPTVIEVTPTGKDSATSGPQGIAQTSPIVFNQKDEADNTTVNFETGHERVELKQDTLTLVNENGEKVTTITVPEVGTYELKDGVITFTPVKTFTGTAEGVTVQVEDENGKVVTKKYVPTVTPVTPEGTPAETTGIQGATQEGTPTFKPGNPNVPIDETVAPTLEGANPEGKVVVPGEGTYTVDKDGKVTFTPEPQFTGVAKGVTVKRVDKNGTPVTAKYTPTVTPVTPTGENSETEGPKAQPQTSTIVFDKKDDDTTTVNFDKGHDSVPLDPTTTTLVGKDGLPTTEVKVPGEGTYTLANNVITFTPESDFAGKSTGVSVQVKDANGTVVTKTYTPTVRPVTTFVDEAGNSITVDKNNTPVVPEEDGKQPNKDIYGYKFVRTETDNKGNTKHVYELAKGQTVKVTYVSTSGDVLKDSQTVQPKDTLVGTGYDASTETIKLERIEKDGKVYLLKERKADSASENGKVSDKEQTITYVYEEVKEPAPKQNYGSVVVVYTDKFGRPISGITDTGKEVGSTVVDTPNSPLNAKYDTTDNRPQTITTKDGKVYTLKKVTKDSDAEQSGVKGRTSVVTYVYEILNNTEEFPEAHIGVVLVNYVDEEGNPISGKTPEGKEIPNVVVDTDATLVGEKYDTTDNKPTVIIAENGDVYELVKASDTSVEKGEVVEGATIVDYIYRKVVTKHVDENGNELKSSEKGSKDKSDISGYVFKETKKDEKGNTVHVYQKVSTPREENESKVNRPSEKVTSSNPSTSTPSIDSVLTTFVDENGNVIIREENGSHPGREIEGYELIDIKRDSRGNVRNVYRKIQSQKPVQPVEPAMPEQPAKPEVPATPAQPVQPTEVKEAEGKRELPNTGTEDNARLAALGLLGVLSGFGLVARKKKED